MHVLHLSSHGISILLIDLILSHDPILKLELVGFNIFYLYKVHFHINFIYKPFHIERTVTGYLTTRTNSSSVK